MKETPIIFSPDMVSALLSGRKTMTRRIVKPMRRISSDIQSFDLKKLYEESPEYVPHPFGKPGDLLWVRENFSYCQHRSGFDSLNYCFANQVVGPLVPEGQWHLISDYSKLRPSIHMPKQAARIWLKIRNVKIERLKEISDTDCISEGIGREMIDSKPFYYFYPCDDLRDDSYIEDSPKTSFYSLWTSINGRGSWEINPWVWVLEFDVITTRGRWL